MRDVIATLERVSGRTLDLVERPAAAGDVRRTSADATSDRARPRLACDDVARRRFAAQWDWASVRVAAP